METPQKTTQEPDVAKEERRERRRTWSAPRIVEIVPGLSLGNVRGSWNSEMLMKHNITGIMSLSDAYWGEWSTHTRRAGISSESHKFVRCFDSATQDLLFYMSDICDFIDRMAPPYLANSHQLPVEGLSTIPSNNSSVLVQCDFGRSRSPTVVIAYLMRKFKIGADEAARFIQTKQTLEIKPNDNFLRQLRVWGEVSYDVWEDGEKTIAKAPYQAFLDDRAVLLEQEAFKPRKML